MVHKARAGFLIVDSSEQTKDTGLVTGEQEADFLIVDLDW